MTQSLSTTIDPRELDQLLRDTPATRVLDVRTPGEFESAHIPGAYNVPLDSLAEHAREIASVTEAPVVVVCQSGQRAGRADQALRALGMANLYVLDGGLNAWRAAGLGVLGGRKRLSLERQVRIAAGALAAIGGLLAVLFGAAFAAIPLIVGSGLVFAGITNTCAMGMLLARLPYNRPPGCDVPAVARALASGRAYDASVRAASPVATRAGAACCGT